MANPSYETAETLFGQKMQGRMDELGLSIKDVSDQIGSTYEYIRKLVRGLASPSRYMLRELVKILELDLHSMEKLVTADKITRTHGSIPLELSGKNPALEPFERLWGKLTEQQQEILLTQLRSFAAQNRKHGVHVNT